MLEVLAIGLLSILLGRLLAGYLADFIVSSPWK